MSSVDSFEQQLSRYISDLENTPLSIHRVWNDFHQVKDLDKDTFIRIFHQIPKTYSCFRIVYHQGTPYILNTKKELWEICKSEYKVPESSEITDSDILKFYLNYEDQEDCPDIPNNFVVKIIEDGESNNLKMILDNFDFTEEDLESFLIVANEKRYSVQNDCLSISGTQDLTNIVRLNHRYVDILMDLLRTKYEVKHNLNLLKENESEMNHRQLDHSYRELKTKYDDLKFHFNILKENESDAKFIKNIFFYSFILGIIYNLYFYL